MAFRYLGAFDRHEGAQVASNNHFDQDGLVGLFALVAPAAALARRGALVEVARAGDFALTSSRPAARVSMVLSAFADPERSPLAPLPDGYDDTTALLYDDLLGRLPELCDRPERWRDLWAEEDATLRASERALASGTVTISEVPDVDLAIVHVAEQAPGGRGAPLRRPVGLGPAPHGDQPHHRARCRSHPARQALRACIPLRELGPVQESARAAPGGPRSTGRAAQHRGGRGGRDGPLGGHTGLGSHADAQPGRRRGERPGPGGGGRRHRGPSAGGTAGLGSLPAHSLGLDGPTSSATRVSGAPTARRPTATVSAHAHPHPAAPGARPGGPGRRRRARPGRLQLLAVQLVGRGQGLVQHGQRSRRHDHDDQRGGTGRHHRHHSGGRPVARRHGRAGADGHRPRRRPALRPPECRPHRGHRARGGARRLGHRAVRAGHLLGQEGDPVLVDEPTLHLHARPGPGHPRLGPGCPRHARGRPP